MMSYRFNVSYDLMARSSEWKPKCRSWLTATNTASSERSRTSRDSLPSSASGSRKPRTRTGQEHWRSIRCGDLCRKFTPPPPPHYPVSMIRFACFCCFLLVFCLMLCLTYVAFPTFRKRGNLSFCLCVCVWLFIFGGKEVEGQGHA